MPVLFIFCENKLLNSLIFRLKEDFPSLLVPSFRKRSRYKMLKAFNTVLKRKSAVALLRSVGKNAHWPNEGLASRSE